MKRLGRVSPGHNALKRGSTLPAARLPIYKAIAQKLRTMIENGHIPGGTYLPSERVLAEEFKCSRVALRQALVELKELGLIRAEHGRGTLVIPKRKTMRFFIGAVSPYVPVSQEPEIVYGLEQRLAGTNCHVMVSNSLQDPVLERERIDAFLSRGVDGLVVVSSPSFANLAYFEEVGRRVPVVIADRIPPEIDLPVIRVDDREGARLGTRLLIDKGHRRIACLTRAGYLIGEERAAGYVTALQEGGIGVEEEYLQRYESEEGLYALYRGCVRLLRQDPAPTAVVAYDDTAARVAYQAAQDMGVEIPGRLSILSLSITNIASMMSPRLCGIKRDQVNVGVRAAELLWSWLETGTAPPRRTFIEPELVAGDSVAEEEEGCESGGDVGASETESA